MDGLRRRGANCTHRKSLRSRLGNTIEAFRPTLDYWLYLAEVASCSGFHQRNVGCKAHLVDVSASIKVIQRVEHYVKPSEPSDIELRFFNVAMYWSNADVRIKSGCSLCSDLNKSHARQLG